MSEIYHALLTEPIFNLMILLFKLTGSLGISIIGLTLIIKTISIPLMIPSLKAAKKQRDLQPELDKIKTKFKHDKKKQAELQMELMKKHGVNPASGCYSMIITILIFTALYTVINQMTQILDLGVLNNKLYFDFLHLNSISELNTGFLYFDLAKPEPYFVLAVLTGLFQFLTAKMSMPYAKVGAKAAKTTPDKKDDIAYNMQQQSLYVMPAMMIFLGASLPSGVVVYLLTSTVFSLFQNYFINGWGGLQPLIDKFKK